MNGSKPSNVEILTDVPESDLQPTIKLCESAGGKATTKKQDNGLWTVTCTYPDKPAT